MEEIHHSDTFSKTSRYCHDQKHGTHDKSHTVEEPCEVNNLTHGSEDELGE